MNTFMGELVGTMLLVILGDGVVAAVLLGKSKAENSGWIVITTGFAFAVAFGVYVSAGISGAHLNPAVTLGFAVIHKIHWQEVPGYIAAQVLGAFLGAVVVWIAYLAHWKETPDQGKKLAVFSTAPAIRSFGANVLSEAIGTFVLVFGILVIVANKGLVQNGLAPLMIGFLIWSIGLSLGGSTGFAINPARDFGPRLAHAILPISGKGSSDWGYAIVPIIGPIMGGVLGAVVYARWFGA